MPGIGSTPLGATPLGTALTAPNAIPRVRSRMRIVERDGNFRQDETGAFATEDATTHRVRLAVITVLKSAAADETLGVTWPKKMGTRFAAELQNGISVALTRLVTERAIKLNSVTAERLGNGRSVTLVEFDNLRTGERDQRVTV